MSSTSEKIAYRWLRSQLQPAKRWLMFSVVSGFGNGILLILQAALLAHIIHQLVMEKVSLETLTGSFIGTLVALLLRAGCNWFREYSGFRAGVQIREVIRGAILDKLRQLGPLAIAEQPVGSWSTLVVEQVEELHDFIARYLPQMALAVGIPVVIMVVAFPMNWAAGMIFLLTAPLIPIFMALVGLKAAEANRKNFQALNRLGGFFLDRLQGMETLRLFQRTTHEQSALEYASEDFRNKTMQVLRLAFLSSTVLEFFASVSIAVLAVYLGMHFLGHLSFGSYGQDVSLFTGLFLLLLAPEYYQPLRELGTHYHAKAKAVGAADSIMKLLERETEEQHQGSQSFPEDQPLTIQAESLTVTGQSGGRPLIHKLSFTLEPGEKVGIIGASGAGKSTLVNALMGFWNYQGQLNVSGQPLSEIQIASWRRQIAWLGQHPLIIQGTVYDNVAFGRDLSRDQVLKALAKAQALDIVERLKDGLESELSEHGNSLSVGQAQRIALARALAEPVKLLILDEPTASLDSYNERLVLDALEALPEECTVITVTHRLNQINVIDRVLMLDKGQLVADGRPDVLKEESEPVRRFLEAYQGSLDNA